LMARELTIPQISVSRGRVAASMGRDGTVNWQTLMIAPPAVEAPRVQVTPAPPSSSAPPPPWRVAVEKVRVDEVAVLYTDQSRAAPLEVAVAGVTLGLSARVESGPARLAGTVDGLDLKLASVAVRDAAAPNPPIILVDQVAVEGGRVDLEARQVGATRV